MRFSLSLSGSCSQSTSPRFRDGRLPARTLMSSATSAACAVRRREWRSSRLGAGLSRNPMTAPSGSTMSRARSRDRSAPSSSPLASRAIASSTRASRTQKRFVTAAEPSITRASASVAACGSPWANRRCARTVWLSPRIRFCWSMPARAFSTDSVSPIRIMVCMTKARTWVLRVCVVTTDSACPCAARKAASASSLRPRAPSSRPRAI